MLYIYCLIFIIYVYIFFYILFFFNIFLYFLPFKIYSFTLLLLKNKKSIEKFFCKNYLKIFIRFLKYFDKFILFFTRNFLLFFALGAKILYNIFVIKNNNNKNFVLYFY